MLFESRRQGGFVKYEMKSMQNALKQLVEKIQESGLCFRIITNHYYAFPINIAAELTISK